MISKRSVIFGAIGAVVVMIVVASWRTPGGAAANSYTQTNLLSDNGAPGTKPDAKLVNAWGMAFFNSAPFWINDEGSGVSELIDGQGNITAALPFVTIPGPGGVGASRPTGIVTNATAEFTLPDHSSALFIFDTLDGTISGWDSGSTAVTMVNNSTTARYTGLATAMIGGTTYLYAANSAGGIDVFDGSFKPFKTTGTFSDPTVPAGLTPFGIQNIDGNLYVTYAQAFTSNGVVDEFTPQGVKVRRFATGGTLNQPWGVVIAPPSFGAFSNDLLIGNFGNGTISAFNPTTEAFLGQLADSKGATIKIDGVWQLLVGAGAAGVTNSNALYFSAGPNGQADGLFGYLTANGPAATATPTKRATATPTRTPTPGPSRTTTPKPTATPKPPVITSIPATIFVGQSFVINGTGFTPGSVVNFFVATSKGSHNAGPLSAMAPRSSTELTVAVPNTVSPGEGFVSVEVINTDAEFANSNLASALLMGSPLAGFPDLTSINGAPLAATSSNPSFATDNVQTVVVQGTTVKLGGKGFDTVYGAAIDLFCACPPAGKVGPFLLNPGDAGLTPTLLTFNLPAKGLPNSPPTGPGAFVISNAGIARTYTEKSNAVSVPIGAAISITSVSQSGKIITVNGTGFSTVTVINFFNSQGGGVVNLGGFKGGTPNIPLTFVSADKFSFTAPAKAIPGPSYVQALNPPFVPYTSSGNGPGGGFKLSAAGPAPTPTPTVAPSPTPTPYVFPY